MAQDPNQRFYENTEGLFQAEAISSSAADQSVIRIDNLDRRLAVNLAHELTKRLDALGSTGRAYNDSNFKLTDSISQADKLHMRGEQTVFEANPAHGTYKVEAKLPERAEMESLGSRLGAYSVVAYLNEGKEQIRDADSSSKVKADLQAGYVSVLNRVDFFPTSEQKSIEKQLLEIGVPVQSDTKRDRELFESQLAADVTEVEHILRNIGVKEIDFETLSELCEIKKWDAITVLDLYIEVMTEMQKKHHEFPEIRLIDLAQHTNYPELRQPVHSKVDSSTAKEIRRRHEEQMLKRFAVIGLEEDEANRRYYLYEGDEDRQLAFRFASWLVSRDFMKQESADIAKRVRMGENMPNIKLFKELTASVYRVYTTFQEERHDTYNLGIDWQNADYQRGHEYYRNMILLCLNIFHGKDISTFREV